MNQVVQIQFCVFQAVDENGKSMGGPSKGYRIFDRYGEASSQGYESWAALKEELNPKHLLELIGLRHPEFFTSAADEGVSLNGRYIRFDEETEEKL